MSARGTFKPGNVETIDKGTYTLYRVRWTNPESGKRHTYSGLVSLADGEDFRAWLRFKGGRVTPHHAALVDGTWRGGDVTESAGSVFRVPTFHEYAKANIEARDVKVSTRRDLRNQLENWFTGIHNVPMTHFDEPTIKKALARLNEPRTFVTGSKGKTRTVTLAPRSYVGYAWFLWGIFTAAVKDGTVSAHPFGSIELPKPESVRRIRTDESFNLSEENYGKLLGAAASVHPQIFELLKLVLVTGLRIGEALALQVKHIEWNDGVIRVRQALIRDADDEGNQIGHVKKGTDIERSDSERDIPITRATLDSLRRYLASEGASPEDRERFVFPRPRCVRGQGHWTYSNWHRAMWKPTVALARSDFELAADIIPTPHCLRHTFASRMLNAGMSVYDVSKLLGHKDTKITERIYLHSVHDDMHKRARDAAASILPVESPVTRLPRNGWYEDANGKKVRRSAA